MDRARPRLRTLAYNIYLADLALLCILVALWTSSYFVSPYVKRSNPAGTIELRSDRGGLYFIRSNGTGITPWEFALAPASRDDLLWTLGVPVHRRVQAPDGTVTDQGWGENAFLGFNQVSVPGKMDVTVVPIWLPVALGCVFACWWLTEGRRILRRYPRGHCPACGYNLRGSAGLCPECGRRFGRPIVVPPPPPPPTVRLKDRRVT